MVIRFSRVLFSAICLAFGIAACSGGGDSGPVFTGSSPNSGVGSEPGGGPNTGGSTSSSSYVCCLNADVYSCPDEAALDACTGFDVDGCMSACQVSDLDCQSRCFDQMDTARNNPSRCKKDPSVASQCASAGGGGGGGGVAQCAENVANRACSYNSDCGTNSHCYNGHCYRDVTGAPCTYNSECGASNHCTSGCCYSDQAGKPCTYNSECGTNNHCYSGTCYRDGTGSPCTYTSECGSGSACVGSRCN